MSLDKYKRTRWKNKDRAFNSTLRKVKEELELVKSRSSAFEKEIECLSQKLLQGQR